MSHIKTQYVSNVRDGCACIHIKQLYLSPQKRAVQLLMPIPNMDHKQKRCALRILSLEKQPLLNKRVLMQKGVHGKAPSAIACLTDRTVASGHLHVHGNKK